MHPVVRVRCLVCVARWLSQSEWTNKWKGKIWKAYTSRMRYPMANGKKQNKKKLGWQCQHQLSQHPLTFPIRRTAENKLEWNRGKWETNSSISQVNHVEKNSFSLVEHDIELETFTTSQNTIILFSFATQPLLLFTMLERSLSIGSACYCIQLALSLSLSLPFSILSLLLLLFSVDYKPHQNISVHGVKAVSFRRRQAQLLERSNLQ